MKKIFIDNTEKNRKLLFNKLLEGKFPLTTEIVIGPSKKIELNWQTTRNTNINNTKTLNS